MKRTVAIFLTVLIMLILCSCTGKQELPTTTVRFYYKAISIEHGSETGVITWEDREILQPLDDSKAIVELYLNGSKKSTCIMPFPNGTSLRQYEESKEKASILLSVEASLLTGAEFTIASVCLARTVIELTGVQSVQISVESNQQTTQHSVTITPDNFVLFDFASTG